MNIYYITVLVFGSVFLYSWFLFYSFNVNEKMSKGGDNKNKNNARDIAIKKYNEVIYAREELRKQLKYYTETENYEVCSEIKRKISEYELLLNYLKQLI